MSIHAPEEKKFTAADITLLNLEFNSSCNLRCQWCSLDHDKERMVMSEDILARVMDELVAGQLPNLRRVDLHNAGETLLHPDLPRMLTIIRRARQNLNSKATFGLLTNATLLTPVKSEQIVRSKAIDQMRFSLDGGTPELFESMRKGASWNKVQANIYNFLKANEVAGRPISTEAICIIPPDLNESAYLDPQFKLLLSMIDKVSLRPPHNWDGSVELEVDDSFYQEVAVDRINEVCFLLKRNLVVLPDGNVTVCCNDLNARGVIGNIADQTLTQLATSPKRLEMLRKFSEGNKSNIELCKKCTGFYSSAKTN
ncbi:SPASM domain-containing protein [Maridesulfovibrio ferrireducens]|uniref:SPASM domain-containing protein n=1 Tax=Maridesulfovibrio ferrireducens TaxID=246191 RepID=UPI001A1B5EF0|nr:SPASM domain-containing protein [Maridesulfovibrio ferrireducens]MBI9111963.1 radical SAM protein [Maridesulfovibrio ferrireducens]